MRIKYTDKDPRFGTIAQMDSSRGQQLIDEGSAILIGENDVIVTALKSFEHEGKKYKAGDTPNIVSTAAAKLADEGKVSLTGMPIAHPSQTGGHNSPLSALPPVPVSEQTISSESDNGDLETENPEPEKATKAKAKKSAKE